MLQVMDVLKAMEADVEREVGVGIIMHAHEACYKLWREELKRAS